MPGSYYMGPDMWFHHLLFAIVSGACLPNRRFINRLRWPFSDLVMVFEFWRQRERERESVRSNVGYLATCSLWQFVTWKLEFSSWVKCKPCWCPKKHYKVVRTAQSNFRQEGSRDAVFIGLHTIFKTWTIIHLNFERSRIYTCIKLIFCIIMYILYMIYYTPLI